MAPVRLFILDALAREGEAHGHRLRQLAEEEYTDLWTDIQVGGFYGALKRMAEEGLVAVVRTEVAGRYPERTVYAITDAGREALRTERDAGLARIVFRADPFDLAFSRAGDLTERELRAVLEARRAHFAGRLDAIAAELVAVEQNLSRAESHVVRHLLARLTTEISWLDELLDDLPAVVAGFDPPAKEPS